jgi:hypothetical protein
MIRFIAIMVVLALGAQPAHAEDCKKAEKSMLVAMKALDKAGQMAIDLVAQCMFRGTDDRAVAKLASAAKTAFSSLSKLKDPAASCVKGGNPADAMKTVGNAAGQRLGLAWALCSPKAQARVAEMHKQGAKLEDIKTELGNMGGAWMQSLMK